jgi:hypothetical protein
VQLALYGVYAYTCRNGVAWYTPADKSAVWSSTRCLSYATRQPARTQGRERCCALIEPCTLAQERLLPNPLSVQRRSNKSWWRTQPSCRTRTQHLRCATLTGSMWFSCMPAARQCNIPRPPAVLRCAVLMHNSSSSSSHYTAYTHTPAEMALYGIHLQTRTPYARSPSSCARAQRQVRLALRVWLPETDLLELSYLPETTLFEIR